MYREDFKEKKMNKKKEGRDKKNIIRERVHVGKATVRSLIVEIRSSAQQLGDLTNRKGYDEDDDEEIKKKRKKQKENTIKYLVEYKQINDR